MLIFKNREENKVHGCQIHECNSFELFLLEAKKVVTGNDHFIISCLLDSQNDPFFIYEEKDFRKMQQKLKDYAIFDVIPIEKSLSMEFKVSNFKFEKSQFIEQINKYEDNSLHFNSSTTFNLMPGSLNFLNPEINKPKCLKLKTFPELQKNWQNEFEENKTSQSIFLSVNSKNMNFNKSNLKNLAYEESHFSQVSFASITQSEFNQMINENQTVKKLDTSICELGTEMQNTLGELRANLRSAHIISDEKTKRCKNTNIHRSVKCSFCRSEPIIGKRFVCLVCPDFELCQICEKRNNHIHPMLRLAERTNFKTIETIKKRTVTKAMLEKISEHKLRKVTLKFFAGSNYGETFYEQFLAKNKQLDFNNFFQKVAQIFG